MDAEKMNVYALFAASLITLSLTLLTGDIAISMIIAAIAFPAIRSLIKNYRNNTVHKK